jgi:hypothetical protein
MSAFVWYGGAALAGAAQSSADASASIAAAIADEWTASATVAEAIPFNVASTIGDEFTAAVTASEAVPSLVTSVIGDEWTAAAQATSLEGVVGSVAATIGNEWAASAALTSSVNITCSVAADVKDDFSASVSLASAARVSADVDAALGNEWSAAAVIQVGAFFAQPGLGNPRISTFGSGSIPAWPTKDPDSFLPYWFNWSGWTAIEQGGNIEFYELAVDAGDDDTLVLTDIAQGSGAYVNWIQIWIRGGTEELTYTVRCSVTLEDGRTEDQSRTLTIASH